MQQFSKKRSSRIWSKSIASLIVLASVLGLSVFSFALEFPYRKDYPTVPTIDSKALLEQYEADKVIIVDVRSSIEYDVIHPEGAVHIPLSSSSFIAKVQELKSFNPAKNLAFYCNGITCLKSYKATQKALAAGIDNCYAYDSGIPIWASTYPKKTLLLGKELVDPDKQLISKAAFKKKCLPIKKFKSTTKSKKSLAVDVRDHIQRSEKIKGLKRVVKIPLDKFIPNFVEKKVNRDKTLLIFDQVGKQVRWLEYYLVANGYKNYYFLAGGATSVLKDQKYKN
jgi:rhodanese-related sulfurtransferase